MDTLVHHAIDGYQAMPRVACAPTAPKAGHARAHRLYGKWQGHIA
jgi:cytochrome c5